jgi:cytochrome c oxidase cbb3-type subunit 3
MRRHALSHTACSAVVVTTAFAAALVLGCHGTPEQVRGGSQAAVRLPADSLLASVPLGDLAGATPNRLATTITNPYANDQGAVTEGKDLFIQMNCVGCHGYDAKGGMGPDLTDAYWRYGGSPAEIYKSVFEGRPEGMPAWGVAVPHDQIWKIVAYIQSLGGAFPARAAEAGRQGNLGDLDTAAAATLKGRQNEH